MGEMGETRVRCLALLWFASSLDPFLIQSVSIWVVFAFDLVVRWCLVGVVESCQAGLSM